MCAIGSTSWSGCAGFCIGVWRISAERFAVQVVAVGWAPASLDISVSSGWSAEATDWENVVEDVWRSEVMVAQDADRDTPEYGSLAIDVPGMDTAHVGLRCTPERLAPATVTGP